MSYRLIIGIVLVIVIVAAAWAQVTKATSVASATVERGEIASYVEERARTTLSHTHRVTMPLNGRVLPIVLKEGDVVHAGQVVASIDPADLETAIAQARARVDRLGALIVQNDDTRLEESAYEEALTVLEAMDRSVEAAREETVASAARYEFAKAQLERIRNVAEGQATSPTELEEMEVTEISSQVDYRKDVLTLRGLEAIRVGLGIWPRTIKQYIDKKSLQRAVYEQERREAQAELERLVRDLERLTMMSPVDGVVVERHVSNERVLGAGSALIDIGRLSDLEIEVEVLTQDAAAIAIGDPVEIFGAAVGDEPAAGRVTRVDPRGFTKVSSLGVEQQRVHVTVGFDDGQLEALMARGRTLGAEYRVRVRIYTDRLDDAVVVPRAALFRGPDGHWRAFVIDGGRAVLREVEIGLSNAAEFEIRSGIDAGETVILAPESSIADGVRVKPRESGA
jgi:HlyD family secretion protein